MKLNHHRRFLYHNKGMNLRVCELVQVLAGKAYTVKWILDAPAKQNQESRGNIKRMIRKQWD
jgi:hypothetical protein